MLHITIIFLVLSQIILSNFIELNNSGEISANAIEFYGTWLYIILGLVLFPIAVVFLSWN